jgi:hypothetical protein
VTPEILELAKPVLPEKAATVEFYPRRIYSTSCRSLSLPAHRVDARLIECGGWRLHVSYHKCLKTRSYLV